MRFSFCAAIFRTLVGGSQGCLWIRQNGSISSVKLVHLYACVWRSSLADNTVCFLTLYLACTHRPGVIGYTVRPNFRSGGPYSLREYGPPPRTQLPREYGPSKILYIQGIQSGGGGGLNSLLESEPAAAGSI